MNMINPLVTTLIKGMLYLILKAKQGGKYLSRKQVIDKRTGRKTWKYKYKPMQQRAAHEVTRNKFEKVTKLSGDEHKNQIEHALQNGVHVSLHVLKDYPDLIKKYNQQARVERADKIRAKVKAHIAEIKNIPKVDDSKDMNNEKALSEYVKQLPDSSYDLVGSYNDLQTVSEIIRLNGFGSYVNKDYAISQKDKNGNIYFSTKQDGFLPSYRAKESNGKMNLYSLKTSAYTDLENYNRNLSQNTPPSPDNREVENKKGIHTEGVQIIGNKAIKKITAANIREFDIYKKLQGINGIPKTEKESSNSFSMPNYLDVSNADTDDQEKRDDWKNTINNPEQIGRINDIINAISEKGIVYDDSLQFGYDGDNVFLLDFSNAKESTIKDAKESNLNSLQNFYSKYGMEAQANIIRDTQRILNLADSKMGKVVLSKDFPEIQIQSGDSIQNYPYIYYSTNSRPINNVIQTDFKNGRKIIFSKTKFDTQDEKTLNLTTISSIPKDQPNNFETMPESEIKNVIKDKLIKLGGKEFIKDNTHRIYFNEGFLRRAFGLYTKKHPNGMDSIYFEGGKETTASKYNHTNESLRSGKVNFDLNNGVFHMNIKGKGSFDGLRLASGQVEDIVDYINKETGLNIPYDALWKNKLSLKDSLPKDQPNNFDTMQDYVDSQLAEAKETGLDVRNMVATLQDEYYAKLLENAHKEKIPVKAYESLRQDQKLHFDRKYPGMRGKTGSEIKAQSDYDASMSTYLKPDNFETMPESKPEPAKSPDLKANFESWKEERKAAAPAFKLEQEDITSKEKNTRFNDAQGGLFGKKPTTHESYAKKDLKPVLTLEGNETITSLVTAVKSALMSEGLDTRAREFVDKAFKEKDIDSVKKLASEYVEIKNSAKVPSSPTDDKGREEKKMDTMTEQQMQVLQKFDYTAKNENGKITFYNKKGEIAGTIINGVLRQNFTGKKNNMGSVAKYEIGTAFNIPKSNWK